MALENLVGADKFLSALVPANPVGGDDKRDGDDHIRGIKNTLRNTFPNLTGAVTATQAELSSVAGKVNKAGDTMTGALTINTAFAPLVLNSSTGQVAAVFQSVGAQVGSVGTGIIPAALDTEFSLRSEGALLFATGAGVERMRITAAGNLAVGTTSVAGQVTLGFDRNALHGFVVRPSADTGPGNNVLFQNAASGTVGSITTTPSATTYATSSDYRLKYNIEPLTGCGEFIDALRPRRGIWKADGAPFAGFIAHELELVSPSSVAGEKDGDEMQQVAYGSAELIANIVAELQSLRARVAELER